MENFILSETNPNDSTGGKGCLCSNRETADCKPPFVVFQGDYLQDRLSPHPVACRRCMVQALARMENPLEIQVVGNRGDDRRNRGRVDLESLDKVREILHMNWIPLPGEDTVPANLADNLTPPTNVAEELTPEQYHEKYGERDNKTIGKPVIREEEEVPSL